MDNFVSNTLSVLNDDSLVPVSVPNTHLAGGNEIAGYLSSTNLCSISAVQEVTLPADSALDGCANYLTSSILPGESYQIVNSGGDVNGAPYFIIVDQGDQSQDIGTADKVFLPGSEMIFIQADGTLGEGTLVTLQDDSALWDLAAYSTDQQPDSGDRLQAIVDDLTADVTRQQQQQQQQLHTFVNPLCCSLCGITFDTQRVYQKHMKQHENDRPFKCETCDVSFNHEVNLKLHNASSHIEVAADDYVCPVCHKQFSRLASFRGHMRWHQLDEDLVCGICFESYKSRVLMDHHMEMHRNGTYTAYKRQKLRCKVCQVQVDSGGQLRQHYQQYHPKVKKVSRGTDTTTVAEAVSGDQVAAVETQADTSEPPTGVRPCKKLATSFLRKILSDQENRGSRKRAKTGSARRQSRKLPDEKELKCAECSKTFIKPSLLQRHMVTHTGEKPFKCEICGKCFSQKSTIKLHMAIHSEVKSFQCAFCFREFTHKCNYDNHIKRVHKRGGRLSHICSICKVCFRKKAQMDSHMLIHQGTGDAKKLVKASTYPSLSPDMSSTHNLIKVLPSVAAELDDLNKSTQSKFPGPMEPSTSDEMDVELTDHETGTKHVHRVIKDSNGKRVYVCRICSKWWKKSVDLIRHMRSHTNERPFHCPTCRKTFRLKSVLQMHLRTHSILKDFTCNVCQKSFTMSQTLRIHKRLHSQTLPYSCSHCSKRFNTSSHLAYHVKRHHEGTYENGDNRRKEGPSVKDKVAVPQPLVWDENKKSMIPAPQPKNRQIHSDTLVAERPHQCEYCHRVFHHKSHMKTHVRMHHLGERPYVCNYCNESFSGSTTLKQHIDRKHLKVRSHRCNLCHATFVNEASLKRHMLVHSSARPFACPVCHKNFKTRNNCKMHINIHLRDHPHLAALSPQTVNDAFGEDHQSSVVAEQHQHHSGLNCVEGGGEDNASLNQIYTDYIEQSLQADTGDHQAVVGENIALIECTDLDAYNSLQNVVQRGDLTALGQEHVDSLATSFINLTSDESATLHNYRIRGGSAAGSSSDNLMNSMEIVSGSIDMNAIFSQTEPLLNASDGRQYVSVDSTTLDFLTRGQQGISIVHVGETENSSTVTPVVSESHHLSTAKSCPLLTEALLSNGTPTKFMRPAASNDAIGSSGAEDVTAQHQPDISIQENIQVSASIVPTENLNSVAFFGCSKCDHALFKASDLVEHVKLSHVIKKTHQCFTCNKVFASSVMLTAHSQKHERPGATNLEAPCPVCLMTFPTHVSLMRHIRMQHSEELKVYRCTQCNCNFMTIREISTHVRNHLEEAEAVTSRAANGQQRSRDKTKNRICLSDQQTTQIARMKPTAKMSLSEKYLIQAAKEKASENTTEGLRGGERPKGIPESRRQYICQYCSKAFLKPSDLKRHVRTHTGERPFLCIVCRNRFPSRFTLKHHMATHSQTPLAFRCHLCESVYSSKYSLRVHMRLHTNTTPYACSYCAAKFRTVLERNRHLTSAHGTTVQKKKSVVFDPVVNVPITKEQSLVLQLCDGNTVDEVSSSQTISMDHHQHVAMLDAGSANSQVILIETRPTGEAEEQQFESQSHAAAATTVFHPNDGVSYQGGVGDVQVVNCEPELIEYQVLFTPSELSSRVHSQQASSGVRSKKAPSDGKVSASYTRVELSDRGEKTSVQSATTSLIEPFWQCTQCKNVFSDRTLFESHNCCAKEVAAATTPGPATITQSVVRVTKSAQTETTTTTIPGPDKVASPADTSCLCEYCGKEVRGLSELKRHLQSHTKERSFQCTHCASRFSQASSLHTHMRVHSEELPHRCPVCTDSFTHRGFMLKHLRQYHPNCAEILGHSQ